MLATLPVIGSEDLIRTAILALIGAVVSFSVSFSLKIVVFPPGLSRMFNFEGRKGMKRKGESRHASLLESRRFAAGA